MYVYHLIYLIVISTDIAAIESYIRTPCTYINKYEHTRAESGRRDVFSFFFLIDVYRPSGGNKNSIGFNGRAVSSRRRVARAGTA